MNSSPASAVTPPAAIANVRASRGEAIPATASISPAAISSPPIMSEEMALPAGSSAAPALSRMMTIPATRMPRARVLSDQIGRASCRHLNPDLSLLRTTQTRRRFHSPPQGAMTRSAFLRIR